MKRRRYLLIGGLLAMHLLMATLFWVEDRIINLWFDTWWCGWITGVVTLLAAWTALARFRDSVLRIPWAASALALLWLLLVGYWQWHDYWFVASLAIQSGTAAVLLSTGAGGIVHLVSWLTRWKLAFEEGELGTGQFRIGHILLLTTLVAVVISTAQFVLPIEGWDFAENLNAEYFATIGIVLVFVLVNTMLVVPVCLWGSMWLPLPTALFFLIFWMVYAAIITIVQFLSIVLLTSERITLGSVP